MRDTCTSKFLIGLDWGPLGWRYQCRVLRATCLPFNHLARLYLLMNMLPAPPHSLSACQTKVRSRYVPCVLDQPGLLVYVYQSWNKNPQNRKPIRRSPALQRVRRLIPHVSLLLPRGASRWSSCARAVDPTLTLPQAAHSDAGRVSIVGHVAPPICAGCVALPCCYSCVAWPVCHHVSIRKSLSSCI
jgi:hypothetical protein